MRILALLGASALLLAAHAAPVAGTDWAYTYRVYRDLAEQGDAKAQQNLGALYHNGQGVGQDYEKAALWWRKAANQGDAQAQYNLGTLYLNGTGVDRNYAEAARLFRLADAGGFAAARQSLQALETLDAMVEQRTAVVLPPADPDELVRKAEAGHPASQCELGTLYYHGEGRPQDLAAAERWYRAAAEQGDARAQFNLASMIAIGEGGLEPDPVQAVMWLDLSKDQNHSANYLLFRLEGELTEDQLAEGRRRAAKWRTDRASASE